MQKITESESMPKKAELTVEKAYQKVLTPKPVSKVVVNESF